MMQDTVQLNSQGSSLGFTISREIVDMLPLKKDEVVSIDIKKIIKIQTKESQEIEISYPRRVRVSGNSFSVTIKTSVIKAFSLEEGDVLLVDIKKL